MSISILSFHLALKIELLRRKNETLEDHVKKRLEENQTLQSENGKLKKEIENIHKTQNNSNAGVKSDPQSTGISIYQPNTKKIGLILDGLKIALLR